MSDLCALVRSATTSTLATPMLFDTSSTSPFIDQAQCPKRYRAGCQVCVLGSSRTVSLRPSNLAIIWVCLVRSHEVADAYMLVHNLTSDTLDTPPG